MQASLVQLQQYMPGAVLNADIEFSGVCIDSRQIQPGNLFVALRGERFDGHRYIAEVLKNGAAAIVSEVLSDSVNAPVLLVPDTRVALGQIAHYWRQQFSLPVIGVTGSNGKTTVKGMIASILQEAFGLDNYLATAGNLNNEIGVPLTLLRLNIAHRAAVVELGMNHPGEIANLVAIAQPTVGLVNNAQREHQEFMATVVAVAQENGAVLCGLPAEGVAVFPGDDPFSALWLDAIQQPARRNLTFGLSADVQVGADYQLHATGSDLSIKTEMGTIVVQLAIPGLHNVRNALAATACALAIGVDVDAIGRGLTAFTPVAGRLQHKQARNGANLIDDTYNANPDSVRAAIEVLAQAAAPRILVLGDMGEVGSNGVAFHQEIGAYARTCGIEHLITLGELSAAAAAVFGADSEHCSDVQAVKHAVENVLTESATVLIKGSRFMRMERVVESLTDESTTETH